MIQEGPIEEARYLTGRKKYNLNTNRTKSKTYTQINRNKHIIRQRLQLSLKSIYHFVLARGQPIKDKSSKAVVLRRGMTCMIGGCGNPDFKQGTNSTLFYGKNQRHTYWSANKRKTERTRENHGLVSSADPMFAQSSIQGVCQCFHQYGFAKTHLKHS